MLTQEERAEFRRELLSDLRAMGVEPAPNDSLGKLRALLVIAYCDGYNKPRAKRGVARAIGYASCRRGERV